MRRSWLFGAASMLAIGCHPSASVVPGNLGNLVIGPALVFDDVRVFDGDADLGVTDVVVREGVIVSIGQVDVSTPAGGVIVIDGRGKTLLPGLIDGHAHIHSRAQLELAAALGVTTVLDMFMDEVVMRAIRREQAKGKLANAADLRSAGILATAPDGHGTEYGVEIPTIASADQAEDWVVERLDAGVDYIKIVYDDGHAAGVQFGNFDPATLEAVIAAAHAHELRAIVHVSDLAAAKQALRSGADGLAHVWFDAPADDEVLGLLAERDAFVIDTLVVMQAACGDPRISAVMAEPTIASLVEPAELSALTAALRNPAASCSPAAATLRQLQDAGVDLVAGTDIPNFGLPAGASLHVDLSLLVAAGLTPTEALRAATKAPAERFGLSDRGRIAPGARADLVLVDGDPMADIADVHRLVSVWKAGHAIDLEARRQAVVDAHAALEARKTAAPPPGSESGLISDFETDLSAQFGLAWEPSIGGGSTVEIDRVENGALDSAGALRIRGTVAATPRAWAGANFFPDAERRAVNLSSKHALRFSARGTPGTHAVLLFDSSAIPVFASFELADPAAWIEVEIDLDAHRVPTWDLMFVFIGATTPGPFELQIDDVRLD